MIVRSGEWRYRVLAPSVLFFACSSAQAQEVSDSNPNQTIQIRLVELAREAVTANGTKQFLPPRLGSKAPNPGIHGHPQTNVTPETDPFHFNGDDTMLPKPGYFVTDVSYNGGRVVRDALNHPVFVNTTPSAVGYPGALLRDLGKSEMVHVIDQYVGLTGDGRYRAGIGESLTYPVTPGVPLQDSDVAAIVYSAAQALGKTGYDRVHHIFLAPGQDVCSTGIGCYSPDNQNTFTFCAYHSSIDFSDIGHVLYSLEPFQAVPGCQTGPPSPNGLIVDSTMDSLSHEFFETISDPDGDAWYNTMSLDENGEEIADICVTTSTTYPVVRLNGIKYELQGEYSNKYHGGAYIK
jgi:hypothetical protein